MALNPTKTASNPRIAKLIELEVSGRIKPEHQQELDTYRAQGLAPARAGGDLTEGQSKSTGFYNRAQGANADFETSGVGTTPRGLVSQAAVDILPANLTNSFTGAERQKADQAKEDFIRASLRYESGAAISPSEFTGQDRIFFPQPGDGPEVIAQKAEARRRVIDSLKVTAGPGAATISARTPTAAGAVQADADQRDGLKRLDQTSALDSDGNLVVDIEGGQLPADQQAEIKARTKDADGFGAAALGLADTITFGGLDEIGSAAEAAFGSGSGSFADRYNARLNVNRGVIDQIRKDNGGAYLLGQVGGGLALPTFGATGVRQLAGLGAGYGGAYGFGSSNGDLGDRVVGTGLGAAAGGAGAAALAGLGGAIANRIGGPPGGGNGGVNQRLVDAAERQKVEIVRPDADPSRRSVYSFLESLPFSGRRVRDDLQRGASQIEQRVSDVGGGNPVPRITAGEAIRDAGERYVSRSRTVTSRLYDRAANLAGNARITPNNALATIDNHIGQLSETPNANRTKLDLLKQIRGDLVDDAGNVRPLSIQAIRDLRTNARDELSAKGLRYTDTERRISDAIDSASNDIRAQLQGPALRAFDRADRAYKERVDIVDNVVEKFIGNDRSNRRSGEAIMASVENAAKPRSGDAVTLDRLMSRLEPVERQQVASNIASQLGRRGVDGDNEFSPALFFSQIKDYSPGAREAIFGKQGAADLGDLAIIAEGRRDTLGRLNNSRSGQVSNWFAALRSILSGSGLGAGAGAALGGAAGVGAGATTGVVATPILLGGAYITARSLGSPRVVSALARAGRATTPPAQIRVLRQLGAIASREPAIANDLLPIRNALQQSVTGAAASPRPADNQVRQNR